SSAPSARATLAPSPPNVIRRRSATPTITAMVSPAAAATTVGSSACPSAAAGASVPDPGRSGPRAKPATTPTTIAIAAAIPRNAATNRVVARRDRAWCAWKSKVAAMVAPASGEGHRGRFLNGLAVGELEHADRLEPELAGDQVGGHGLDRVVVAHPGVVVGLARVGDPVLSRGQLLLELAEVFARFEVGISFRQREQPPEHAAEGALGLGELRHGAGVADRALRLLPDLLGLVAGPDHRLERLAFVLHVALDRLDQPRDQVVAPFQLHVDLGERVGVGVAQAHEAIV